MSEGRADETIISQVRSFSEDVKRYFLGVVLFKMLGSSLEDCSSSEG